MMKHFEFEHTHKWTEEQYVDLNRIFSKRTQWIVLIVAGMFGIFCLFWSYILFLGIFTLALVAIMLFMPHIVAGGSAYGYRTCPFLREKLTYGVSNQRLWLYGSMIEVRVPWASVHVWDEREGWLRISPIGSPALWFPVSKLKDAGIYDRTIELCQRYGVRFNSRAERTRRLSRPILSA